VLPCRIWALDEEIGAKKMVVDDSDALFSPSLDSMDGATFLCPASVWSWDYGQITTANIVDEMSTWHASHAMGAFSRTHLEKSELLRAGSPRKGILVTEIHEKIPYRVEFFCA
jgi:hypothetical protein